MKSEQKNATKTCPINKMKYYFNLGTTIIMLNTKFTSDKMNGESASDDSVELNQHVPNPP